MIVVGRSILPVSNQARQKIPVLDSSKVIELPFPGHHLAHALSAYYCSPFKKSVVLVVDQMGSHIQTYPRIYEKHSIYFCDGTKIKTINKYFGTTDDLSLGLFYDYFTNGFEFAQSPFWGNAGKLMGLSAYGRQSSGFPDLIKTHNGNTVILKNDIYRFFKKLGLKIDETKGVINACVSGVTFKMSSLTTVGKNLAYKAQEELEKSLLSILDYSYKKTRCENLCLAGGVALNSSANGKILKHSKFKNVFIQPASMDDGTAIGLAFYGWHHVYRKKKRFVLKTAYLGRNYDEDDLLQCLKDRPFNLAKKYFKKCKNIARRAGLHLAKGKTLGWFQGASEFGPRALGHRSIIADPRNAGFKDTLNKIKGRELFRPFAASILLEECRNYFDLDTPSPFMLIVAKAKENQISKIPAVMHVDGTSRVQTVTKADNDKFYDLINEFKKITGIPLVLNTSFNSQNEPLAETPKDALEAFLKMKLDYLVIGNYILERKSIPKSKLEKLIRFSSKENKKIIADIATAEKISDYKEEDFKKLLDLKLSKAITYKNMRRYAEAIRDFKELMKQNRDMPAIKNGDIFQFLGESYLSLKRYKQAIEELKKAEKINPKSTQVKSFLIECYRNTHQRKKIDEQLVAVLKSARGN
ncbi:carbamoyltransferase C-terminal domain-containing protein [Candidatus Omnitrophota bacterium]